MNAVRQLSGGESQEQQLTVSAQAEARKPSWAEKARATIAGNIGAVRSFLRKNAAILTILGAGTIGSGAASCDADASNLGTQQDDTTVETIDSFQKSPALESSEAVPLANRTVKLTFDNAEWHLAGTYPSDFVLKVFADDKLVYDDVVAVTPNDEVEGQSVFSTHGVGINLQNTKRIRIQPFEVNEDGSDGKEIPVSNHPPANGMRGNAEIGNLGVL